MYVSIKWYYIIYTSFSCTYVAFRSALLLPFLGGRKRKKRRGMGEEKSFI
jgi:hypothetical protein